MTEAKKLKPATAMVKANHAHVLNESKAYRQARDALAAEEIELRRHIVWLQSSGGHCHRVVRFSRTTALTATLAPSASPSCLVTKTLW